MSDKKIIEVTWIDSNVLDDGGWIDFEDVEPALEIAAMRQTSVGYLVSQSEHAICLAGSLSDTTGNPAHDALNCLVIPKVAILSKREVKRRTR